MKKAVLFILLLVLIICLAFALLAFLKEFGVFADSPEVAEITTNAPDSAMTPESTAPADETTGVVTTTDDETTDTIEQSTESLPSETTEETTTEETTEVIITEIQTSESTNPSDPPDQLNNIPEPYRSVLNNEKRFIVDQQGASSEILLDEYCFPYSFTPIIFTNVEFAVVDMDGDGEIEVVLTGAYGDILVLHNEDGTVYGFSFIFRNMYYIKTDGTFSWNDMGLNGLVYGISKLGFVGPEYRWNELCHVEDDGTDNFSYFVGNKAVTESEYDAFISTVSQEEIEWYPFDRYPAGAMGG